MRSTPSLPLLPGPLWLGVVALIGFYGQIDLFDIQTVCKQMALDATLLNAQHYKVRIKGKIVAIQGKE